MSNNLLQQTNFFSQDFDQSLFFFYPKQFTFDLKLDGIEVINPTDPVFDFNPTSIGIDFVRSVNGSFAFNRSQVSTEFINTRLMNSFNFVMSELSLNFINAKLGVTTFNLPNNIIAVLGLNKQTQVQFDPAPVSNIIFIRESSLNISIAI